MLEYWQMTSRSYQRCEEPPSESWVLDWSEWGATYELVQERRKRHDQAIAVFQARGVGGVAHRPL